MTTACSYADDYKALRAPTCGCQVCEQKWEAAVLARERNADTLAAAGFGAALTSKSSGAKRFRAARRPVTQ